MQITVVNAHYELRRLCQTTLVHESTPHTISPSNTGILPTIWAVLSTTVGIRVAALLFKSAGPPFPHGAISTKCECVVCLPNMMDPSRGT